MNSWVFLHVIWTQSDQSGSLWVITVWIFETCHEEVKCSLSVSYWSQLPFVSFQKSICRCKYRWTVDRRQLRKTEKEVADSEWKDSSSWNCLPSLAPCRRFFVLKANLTYFCTQTSMQLAFRYLVSYPRSSLPSQMCLKFCLLQLLPVNLKWFGTCEVYHSSPIFECTDFVWKCLLNLVEKKVYIYLLFPDFHNFKSI